MKLVTFLNLELISSVLFAIVLLVGLAGYVRIVVQSGIVFFYDIRIYLLHAREKTERKMIP